MDSYVIECDMYHHFPVLISIGGGVVVFKCVIFIYYIFTIPVILELVALRPRHSRSSSPVAKERQNQVTSWDSSFKQSNVPETPETL